MFKRNFGVISLKMAR